MQSLRVASSLHHAAGELVDDDDLVVPDDVLGVAGEELVCAQCLVDVMDEPDIVNVVERACRHQSGVAQQLLDPLDARFGQGDGALLLVLLEIAVLQRRDQLVNADVELGIVLGRTGDDQRGARLVDQDRVDLVNDRVVKRPMDHVL